jgi:Fe-S cluster assembly protein SufD
MKTREVKVKAGEMKIVPILWFGDEDRAERVRVILDKPGSSAKVLCVFYGKHHAFNLETEVVHKAKDTFSRTVARGVLDGDAKSNYEGRVVIEKGAKNADTDLNERVILLSSSARARAIPRLEVLENEVKAGHGATVGKIDEDQLFYLASRGFALDDAKKLIVRGFLEALISEFPAEEAAIINAELARI